MEQRKKPAGSTRTEYVDADAYCSLLISPRRLARSIGPTSTTRALRDVDTGVTFVIRHRDLEAYLAHRRGVAVN